MDPVVQANMPMNGIEVEAIGRDSNNIFSPNAKNSVAAHVSPQTVPMPRIVDSDEEDLKMGESGESLQTKRTPLYTGQGQTGGTTSATGERGAIQIIDPGEGSSEELWETKT